MNHQTKAEAVYNTYYNLMFNIAFTILHNKEDAEDTIARRVMQARSAKHD